MLMYVLNIARKRVSLRDAAEFLGVAAPTLRRRERQKQVLELSCACQGQTCEVIADLGSGVNGHKKGFKRLLAVVEGKPGAGSP